MPKYVVDPESQYKKGTVDDKRVTLNTPVELTKDQVTRLEEVGVTVVDYKDPEKATAGSTSGNN